MEEELYIFRTDLNSEKWADSTEAPQRNLMGKDFERGKPPIGSSVNRNCVAEPLYEPAYCWMAVETPAVLKK